MFKIKAKGHLLIKAVVRVRDGDYKSKQQNKFLNYAFYSCTEAGLQGVIIGTFFIRYIHVFI